MKRLDLKQRRKKQRKLRVRKKISGTAERPRLSVYKSNRYMYIQAIDDVAGTTLTSLSSTAGEAKDLKQTVADATKFGEIFGGKLKEQNITEAVFDRNGNIYHGVVKAIAEGTRKAGIRL
ncbi:MAG: 50S ribosomal protein L18 [Spirochaetaceae bacterium]